MWRSPGTRARALGLAFSVLGLSSLGCDRDPPAGRSRKAGLESTSDTLLARTAAGLLDELATPTRDPLLADELIDWSANPVMLRLGKIAEGMQESEYSAAIDVNEKRGSYRFDCSGMAHWVLRRSAPVAAASIARGLEQRPLARDYARRIARVAPGRERGGWQRVDRVGDARPGDVVAWIKPDIIRSPNTGHVAFLVHPPVRAQGYQNVYLVRVADSTRLLHDDDTRAGRSGFGFGTIALVVDADDRPIAYGWVGLAWRTFETEIALGRPLR